MDRPATKADLDAALDRQFKKITRNISLIIGMTFLALAILLEITR